MGQAFVLVNFDKKQYIHPHKMDDGYKLGEIGFSSGGTASALCLLIATNSDRFEYDPHGVIGSWAGDRIALVGEYGAGDCERFAEEKERDASVGLRGFDSSRKRDDLWSTIRMEYAEISDSIKAVVDKESRR